MRKIAFLCFVVLATWSCKSGKSIGKTNNDTKYVTNLQPNYSVTLTGNNLSETFSKNDEVLFFLYKENENNEPPTPILLKTIIFTKENNKIKYNCNFENIESNDKLIFVLVELDTKKTLSQVEPVVRINYKLFLAAQNDPKSTVAEKFLGDDDLLGIKRISFKDLLKLKGNINFEGSHLMDAYSYNVQVQKL